MRLKRYIILSVFFHLFNEYQEWLESITEAQALPKSPIRQAINYCLKNWDALMRYTADGDLSIDNNAAEREMKQIAIGRNYAPQYTMLSKTLSFQANHIQHANSLRFAKYSSQHNN